jgi:hypothetical protein
MNESQSNNIHPIQQKMKRIIPQNSLEVDVMTTIPGWGVDEIPFALREKLTKYGVSPTKDADGKDVFTTEDLQSLLAIFTKDLRFGNLTAFQEYECNYFLMLGADCLEQKFPEAFVVCMSRVAGILELSQSRGGFFRKRSGTITQENFVENSADKKKGWLNKGNENNSGMNGGMR